MKRSLIIIVIFFCGLITQAQYNPLWIKYCRDIPSKDGDYDRLAGVLNGKNQGQAADSEMDLLLGICYLGSGKTELADQMFSKIANSTNLPPSRANIAEDAKSFQKFLQSKDGLSSAEIVTEYLNLRRGPDAGAPLRGRAFHGETYSVLEEKDNWVYIINIKGQGWVLKSQDNSQNVVIN